MTTITDNSGSQKGLDQWQVEHLRTTAFFLPHTESDVREGWWESVVGTPPEEERRRPQEGSIRQIGRLSGNVLAVEWRSERVDWRLIPPGRAPNQPRSGFPVIGTLSDTLDSFLELSGKGLEQCGSVNRVALGMVLLIPVDNIAAAYTGLQKYLPNVKMDLDGAVDFLYQINRPSISREVDGITINRLTKWSVSISGSIAISLVPASGILVPDPNPHFASRLELDVNTAPTASLIPADKITALFGELARLGTEIANKGDIP